MKMLKEQVSAGPELEKTEGGRTANNIFQPECMIQQPGQPVLQEGKWKQGKRLQQCWETQWQESIQTPHSAWDRTQLSEAAPWDDAKAFLASFEQVAVACGWPRGEWASRLLPALSGAAQQAFGLLAAPEREDYRQVKAAILSGEALRREKRRQHFRQFCCPQLGDPQRMYSQVQELCCQWLKPERHSKEQILDLLVLEQFVDSLPVDIQSQIRAGEPENGAQAVALLEDFLVRRREAETRNWQGLLKEYVGSMEAEEEPTDTMKGQISKEIKQTGDVELNLLGSGIQCSSSSNSSLPSEQQEMSRAGLNEGVRYFRESDMSLHVVEQTLTSPDQYTIFRQVQEEDGGNLRVLDGLPIPKPDIAAEPEKEEDMSVQFPGPGVLSQDSGSHIKVESIHWEEMGSGETLTETAQCSFPVVSEMPEWRWKSRGHSGQKPVEEEDGSSKFMSGFPGAVNETSKVQVDRKKHAYSRSGQQHHYKPGFAMSAASENSTECPILVKNSQQKCCLNQHNRIYTGERHNELPEYEERWKAGFVGLQSSQVEERAPGYPESGKSFSSIKAIKRDQGIKTLPRKHYECAVCRKHFQCRQGLNKHHKIHTGEKQYGCFVCGKRFISREPLRRHQRIHTGEKPFTCAQCGKCFRQRVHLMCHQKTHYGGKSFKCPKCGMSFPGRDKLITHQIAHQKQRPYECPKCRKSFVQKKRLMKHWSTHKEQ